MAIVNYVKVLGTLILTSVEGKLPDFLAWVVCYAYCKIRDEWSKLQELDGELERIQKLKDRIEALLTDADERRKIEDETVMMWLRELYSLALDAEDLLDVVRTRRHDPSRQQQQNSQATPSSTTAPNRNKRKRSVLTTPSSAYQCSSHVSQYQFNKLVVKEVEAIKSELNRITEAKKSVRLQQGDAARVSADRDPPPAAPGTIDEFVGMIGDKQAVITLLLQDDPQQPPTRVVAIKGIGGSGKTATAQSACNDKEVTKFFPKMIWVNVKRNHSAETIISEMLERLGERHRFCNFDTSLRRLRDLVSKKKLLVVLDNVEDAFLPIWDTLRTALSAAPSGSKVLVTTTSNEVARRMDATTHQLTGLTDQEWLQLFTSKTGDLSRHPRLLELAMEIGKRSQRSPFAAKSLGSLMSGSRDVTEWVGVLGGERLPAGVPPNDPYKEIHQMLRRSYEFLPLYLKRCFGFCAIFPDDHMVDREELAKIWSALGFVQGGSRSAEAHGRTCFRQLESKSFFEEDNGRYYKIPRLMHDLARSVSAHECLTVGTGGGSGDGNGNNAKPASARHMLLNCSRVETESEALGSSLQQADHRRTFIMLTCLSTLPGDLFLKMPCLRVLDLSCTTLYNLPESVGELELLRYLNLYNTNIAKLPDSVTSLRNLQTLNLGECYFLHELPQEISNLTDLRHLDLRLSHPRRSNLASMPPNIGMLTRLHTLSRFIVGERSQGCGIDQLQHLENIHGDLWLSGLENVKDAVDAGMAKLADKKGIEALTLEWQPDPTPPTRKHSDPETASSSNSSSTSSTTVPTPSPPSSIQNRRNIPVADSVIEHLRPPPYLKTLRIYGLNRDTPPRWIPLLEYLESVRITHCQFHEPLKVLEMLPRLRHVHLEQLQGVTAVKPSDSTGQPFKSLETATLRNMTNLVEWSVGHAQMPKLKELRFLNCPNLRDPSSLFAPSLVKIDPRG